MRQSVTAGLASAALVGLIVTACQEQPMAPQEEGGSAPVDPSLVLVDDTTSTIGLLIDSAEFQIDTSSTFQHYGRVLWELGTLDAPVLVEVAVDIAHDGRAISARELIARGDTLGPILYYHTNGDLMYRRIDLQFYAEDSTAVYWHDVVLGQTGQTVLMRDTDAA